VLKYVCICFLAHAHTCARVYHTFVLQLFLRCCSIFVGHMQVYTHIRTHTKMLSCWCRAFIATRIPQIYMYVTNILYLGYRRGYIYIYIYVYTHTRLHVSGTCIIGYLCTGYIARLYITQMHMLYSISVYVLCMYSASIFSTHV
jgi:hypothetical protein